MDILQPTGWPKKWGHSTWLATSLDALTDLRHFGTIKQYFILKTFIMPLP